MSYFHNNNDDNNIEFDLNKEMVSIICQKLALDAQNVCVGEC